MSFVNERQMEIARIIGRSLNGVASADRIAARLGYRPARAGRLAVSSSLRAMHRAGTVGRIPPEDQWDNAGWFLTVAGKSALASRIEAATAGETGTGSTEGKSPAPEGGDAQ